MCVLQKGTISFRSAQNPNEHHVGFESNRIAYLENVAEKIGLKTLK